VDGVKQVPAPWAEARSQHTRLFETRLIDTCRECDVSGVMRLLATTWDATWGVLTRAVARGLARKPKRVPTRLGIDEKAIRKGHHYETLVCDLDRGTVEGVVDDRTQASLEAYFHQFTREELATVEAIAMDMWEPYILATHACVPDAGTKIVFDRYHATCYVTAAVDTVRRKEHKVLAAEGDERLKGTRYLWLWNAERIPEWRRAEFEAVQRIYSRRAGRGPSRSVAGFWNRVPEMCRSTSPGTSELRRAWPPIIEAAQTLRRHLPNLLTYCTHGITNAMAEGINSKIQTVKLMACGYRNREHYKTAIYFHCGGLDLYPRLEAA
jgi:transposase